LRLELADVADARKIVLDDYDDLLLYWAHTISDIGLANEIGSRFDHILVDEYQDTNRLQAAIPSRERFLTELTLDPSDATSDQSGMPLLDEDYLILSTIHSAKGQEWKSAGGHRSPAWGTPDGRWRCSQYRMSGSQWTQRWRKPDSNPRSRGRPPPSSRYRVSSRRLLRCGKESRHDPLSRNLGRLTRY
jgi:hypothetical protein